MTYTSVFIAPTRAPAAPRKPRAKRAAVQDTTLIVPPTVLHTSAVDTFVAGEPAVEVAARRSGKEVKSLPMVGTWPTKPAAAWPTVAKSTKTPLVYQMGIELTMMPPELIDHETSEHDNLIADGYGTILKGVLKRDKFPIHNSDGDMRAVEVSSRVLKTWGEVFTFYDTVATHMRRLSLVPHVSSCISGGGHIHLGKMPVDLMVNITRDIQNRPYIGWVFNDPDDSKSAKTYTGTLSGIEDKVKVAAATINIDPSIVVNRAYNLVDGFQHAMIFYGNPKFITTEMMIDSKYNATRYCQEHETLELRFFQSPVDWAEQEAHIRFVEAYIRWIAKTHETQYVVTTVDTKAKLAAFTVARCRAEFYQLLTTLGLPHAPYDRMVNDNLEDRFKRGERT